jgi:hypothetical protein
VCRLDEQAVELARASARPQEHGEAHDIRARLGDAHETILDPFDWQVDRVGMREELLAVRLPVQRRPALQLDQRSLLGRPSVTNEDPHALSRWPITIADHHRARRVSPRRILTGDQADCMSRALLPDECERLHRLAAGARLGRRCTS